MHNYAYTPTPRLTRRMTLLALAAILLITSCLGMALYAHPSIAKANGAQTIRDAYGVSRSEVVSWLKSHEGDDFYLGTPYRPYDWRSPNGDINNAGANSDGVNAGMNCTGFVWHALCAAHGWNNDIGDRLPALSGWTNAIEDNDLENYIFENKDDMLSSGILEKGDIIWMWDGQLNAFSDYNHIGIFWGDTSNQDLMWHSSSDGAIELGGYNCIGNIEGKAPSVVYQVVKLGGSLNGGISLQKSSALPAVSNDNSCYSLEGAVYGLYDSYQTAASRVSSSALRTYSTNAAGSFTSEQDIPQGTYYVAELFSPTGYALDNTIYEVSVEALTTTPVNGAAGVQDVPTTNPVSLWAAKHDAQTSEGKAQGAATLAGALFEVCYYDGYYDAATLPTHPTRTWVVATGEDGRAIVSEENKVSGDAFYYTREGQITIPLGTVTVRESQAPEGYLLGDGTNNAGGTRVIRITSETANESIGVYAAPTVDDLVKRGDFQFVKVDGQTSRRLAHIPFLITSTTTGEAHVAVTDSNGQLNTAADWVAHTALTNANDEALANVNGNYVVNQDKLNDEAGIWFSGHPERPCAAKDALGALPYDTYTVRELRCNANEGYQLVEFSVTITRHARTLDMGTVDDNAQPLIGTQLEGDNGLHVVPAASVTTLIDTVEYANLDVTKTYTLKGALHEVSTDEEDAGTLCQAEQTFTPRTPNGSVEVVFTLDTTNLQGARMVAYEVLVDENEQEQAHHEELLCEDQTVRVPAIRTMLNERKDAQVDTFRTTDSKPDKAGSVADSEPLTLVDTLYYEGLVPGSTYTARGTMHVRAADGSDAGVATDTNGEPVTATQTFTAEQASGTTLVTFQFKANQVDGTSIVAFEELEHNGRTFATHADINNKDQTFSFTPRNESPTANTSPEASDTPEETAPAAHQQKLPKTGDKLFALIPVLVGIALVTAGTGIALCIHRARRRRQIPVGRGPRRS